jgi:membrane-bound serine protease (ClpP class)
MRTHLPRRQRAPWLAPGILALLVAAAAHAAPHPSASSDSTAGSGTTPLVFVAPLADAIGPASARFLIDSIDRAEKRHAECLVIELDTPGGLESAMRDIVKRILAADVPVVVYVAPSGARAASAGVWILLSAQVAAMAPGTNTGAAHPVAVGGGEVDDTMRKKLENDAASFIRSVAQKRGRNVDWAEKAVRESASASDREALELHIIDVVEPSLQALLVRIDGRQVEVASGPRTLHTRAATIETLEMGWRARTLSAIANPNVAYILLMLGSMGLMMELWNPGAIFPGVVGAISLLLAFFAFQVLPVNSVGLLLILLGIILLLLEIKVTSYGTLTLGGVAALTFGSLLLFETPEAFYRVSWGVLVPTVSVVTLVFLFIVGKGLMAQRARPVTGASGMIGLVGTADSRLDPGGRVFVRGEYWNARSLEPIEAGSSVEVLAIEGLRLVVRPR